MITKSTYKTTCDVKNCRNIAEYCFETKGKMGKTYLCRECLEKIIRFGVENKKVKSVVNAVKKAMTQTTTKE
ncbi:MAG: hypothetical protein J6R37_01665 [Clostridia bacterium]|nr:hypothetical protein [Clostridia bacterium]